MMFLRRGTFESSPRGLLGSPRQFTELGIISSFSGREETGAHELKRRFQQVTKEAGESAHSDPSRPHPVLALFETGPFRAHFLYRFRISHCWERIHRLTVVRFLLAELQSTVGDVAVLRTLFECHPM